jgi:hypothetical protein
MTNDPEPQALAEAARRHAIATVRAQLAEIVACTRRVDASEDGEGPTEGMRSCARWGLPSEHPS